MWQLRFEERAEKDLNKIPREYKGRILSFIHTLQFNPYLGKKLEGKYKDFYSYRVWPYRVIYKIYKKILLIIIVRIGHRQGIYK